MPDVGQATGCVAAPVPDGGHGNGTADEQVAGMKLFTLETMKMETTIYAERAGKAAEVLVTAGTQVEGGDLLMRFEP